MKKNIDIKSAQFKSILLFVYDIIAVNAAYILTMLIENDGKMHWDVMLERAIPVTAIFVLLLFAFGIYSSIWKYAGIKEVANAFTAVFIGGLSSVAVDIIMSYLGFSSSELKNGCFSAPFYIVGTMLAFAFIIGLRVFYRLARRNMRSMKLHGQINRVMIVGAGDMGMIMISELAANNFSKGKPIVAVDDSPYKSGKKIHGVPVKGTCEDIPYLAEKYKIDTIILCIPSASAQRQTEILRIAVRTGCKLKTSPSLLEMYDTTESTGRLRDVNIEDLLSRPEVKLNPDVCNKYIKDKVVLVTGGGGSIGSELCRQIAKYHPDTIVIFDIYENGAYLLKNQIDSYFNGSPKVAIRIGSVRDESRLKEVFDEFHPSVVFHAAAHKHVPLMEDSPLEAVKNNVFGTYNLAKTAVDYSVERFVSISTDKAVNPANVMGATKRVTEMIIQYFQRKCSGSTLFAAVRFGNVLGSNGSVIPIFTEQIKNG
ncbi:MAG: polysaccharide biosynthesis protein, partial [Clostridia bacterium]|nr:polysaccharide biosynthesis protein [Clostridia bacterium]